MVRSTEIQFPDVSGLIDVIEAHTRKGENVYLDAVGLSETLFGKVTLLDKVDHEVQAAGKHRIECF